MRSVLIEKPVRTPVDLAAAKHRVRQFEDDDNDQIEMLIESVVSHLDGVDGILGRALISQDWADVSGGFATIERIRLVLDPVQLVLAVTYYDENNQLRTLANDAYSLHADASGSYIRLAAGYAWPKTFDRDDAVSITYRAGYGNEPSDVPGAIRLAILDLVAHRYVNVEAVLVGTTASDLPRGVAGDLRPYTRPHF